VFKHTNRDDLEKRLATLPYLAGYKPAPLYRNVRIYKPGLAFDGLNIYTSGHASEAFLIDMEGKLLHKWEYPFDKAWPEFPKQKESRPRYHGWRRVHLFENGDLLAIYDRVGIVKIDKNSNLMWSYLGGCHHDLFVSNEQNIYVLTAKKRIIPRLNPHVPIEEDFITVLDREGREIKHMSILEIFEKSAYKYLLIPVQDICTGESLDIFHTNTIEVFDGTLAKKSSLFKEGNILISIKNINAIAILDPEKEDIVWAYGPNNMTLQHQPTLLENGNILVFDNGIKYSRVVELNPLSFKVIWEFAGDERNIFFSATCGSNQRLPNGNTLITESDNGRAFEVNLEGEIVWEFINPHRAGENQELIATLYEMVRFTRETAFLREEK
jgi:hypothetical protein